MSLDETEGTTDTDIDEFRLSNFRCLCDLTDEALHDLFTKPVVFKNRVDRHMRPREEEPQLVHPHRGCMDRQNRNALRAVDLSLFAVSREIEREALRIFYSTNTFSFSSAPTVNKWLGVSHSPATLWSQSLRPPSNDCVQKLRLENRPFIRTTYFSEVQYDAGYLARALEALSIQLPNLASLHLSITIDGYVTCFRKAHATAFERLFRPLGQLMKLKTFTLVILEDDASCNLAIHDTETHAHRKRDTYYERKEIRQMWAEEIRKLVMDEKMEGPATRR